METNEGAKDPMTHLPGRQKLFESVENARKKISSGINAIVNVDAIVGSLNLREEIKCEEFTSLVQAQLDDLKLLF